jgi:RNA polymerase sigma-70 factor (ECF subfamily)
LYRRDLWGRPPRRQIVATVDSIAQPFQAGRVIGTRTEALRLALGRDLEGGVDGTRGERQLILSAQDGSEEALEALFRRHWKGAHRAAYVIVRDPQAAEDIAQEAFLAAIRALGRFDRRRPFRPWLHRIVVNRAIDHTRARALRREVGEEAGEAVAAERAGGLDDDLMAALAELAPEQRAVIVLRYLLDYTPGEIARMLELPRGTVNSRIRRGLDWLAGTLGEGER